MNIYKTTQRLQTIASKDKTRHNISGVHYDRCGLAVATDGCALAATKVGELEKDALGITLKFSSPEQKGIKGSDSANFSPIAGTSSYATYYGQTAELLDHNFPDWKLVIPEDRPKHSIVIDPYKLMAIAKALGVKEGTGLKIEFSDPEKIMIVTTAKNADGFGLLCPMRTDLDEDHGYKLVSELVNK